MVLKRTQSVRSVVTGVVVGCVDGENTEDGLLPGKFKIVEEKAPNGFALKPTLEENTYDNVNEEIYCSVKKKKNRFYC